MSRLITAVGILVFIFGLLIMVASFSLPTLIAGEYMIVSLMLIFGALYFTNLYNRPKLREYSPMTEEVK